MGYESKIIFVDRHSNMIGTWGNEICRFDLSCMGSYIINGKTFKELFIIPIDFDLNVNKVDDEHLRTDNYGEYCCYTNVDTIITWLESYLEIINYRRAELFLSFLYIMKEQINNNRWNEICVVHYGY